MKRNAGSFAALLLGAALLCAAGPKSGGDAEIHDDSHQGSAGSVQLTGGTAELDGSLGAWGSLPSASGTTEMEPGYFSKIATAPVNAQADEVFSSSGTFSWADPAPANPAGTLYRLEASTASDFTGTLVSNETAGFAATLTGLSVDTTYYARVGATYSGWQDSLPAPILSTATAVEAPGFGVFADFGPYSITLDFTGGANTGGQAVSGWAAASALPEALYSHGMTAVNGRVYAAGGILSGGVVSSGVWSAAMLPDGSLGSWIAEGTLPAPREALVLVSWGGRLYAIGGFDGSAKATVYWAPLEENGRVGEWSLTESLPGARFKHGALAHDGYLYVFGGDNGIFPQSTVYSSPITDNGPIGSWTAGTSLPAARNGHAVAVSSGRVYLSGGVGIGLETTVWRADLAGGTVGAWTAETAMPAGRFRHASAASRDRLYLLGGFDGSVARSEVYVATVSADGTLGVWSAMSSMATARFMGGLAFDGTRFYAAGGFDGTLGMSVGESTALTGVLYLSEAATDSGFSAIASSASWQYGTTFMFSTLAPNTTYYLRARARGLTGRESPAMTMPPLATLPARPSSTTPSVSMVEAGSFTVVYLDGNNAAGTEYKVEISTSSDFYGAILSDGFTTDLSTSLTASTANEEYFIRVKSRGAGGRESPYRVLGSTRTLAAVPAGAGFSGVQPTGFTLFWTANANAGDTLYEAQVSSEANFASIAATSSTLETSALFSGLISASTFYARVRAFNGGGIASPFSAAISTETGLDIFDPERPGDPTAYQSGNANALRAYWIAPGDDAAAGDLPVGSEFFIQWSTDNPAGVLWSTNSAQVQIATGPVVRGTTVSYELTGLPATEIVSMRVWARDEAGNFSAPSDTFTAFASPFSFASVSGSGISVGTETALALDGQDRLVALYSNAATGELLARTRSAGVWSGSESVDTGGTGRFSSLALDSADGVHAAGQGSVRYSSRSAAGSWTTGVPDAAGEGHASLSVAGGGSAQIAYNQGTAGSHLLRHGRYEAGTWVLSTVDNSAARVGRYPSLALDGAGKARISYSDSVAGTLKFAEWNAGAWLTYSVAAAGGGDVRSALALDADDGSHIAYRDNASGELRFAGAPTPGTWNITAVDTGDLDLPALALDGDGRPHVAYVDAARGDLKYASYNGVLWSTQTVDSQGTVSGRPGIVVTGTGEVWISYRAPDGSLRAASAAVGVSGGVGGSPNGRGRAPRNLFGTVVSSVSVQWTWLDNSGNELGYRLYGSESSTGPFTLIAGTDTISAVVGKGTLASFVETGLTAGTTYYRYTAAVNAGGVSVSTIAGSTPFNTTDATPPSITINQSGDLVWRRANTAVYDVDFIDLGGSQLDRVEVKASTVAGGGGPDLIAFTNALVSIGSDTFNTDWPLPTAVWDALEDGATNYITIRAIDGLLNSSTTVDAFFVLKDTSPPVLADNQNGDDAIRPASGTLYDLDAFDSGSGLVRVQYSVSPTPGSGDAAQIGWTDLAVMSSSAAYTTDWEVAFASLISGTTNFVSVRAWDLAGSTATLIDAFYVLKDVDGALVAVTAPASSHYSALALISGTAADASGLSGVEVSIQTGAPTGLYWSGAAFDSVVQVWLSATGTGTWTLTPAIAWQNGGAYSVVARSSDSVGNLSPVYSTATFTFDASSPTAGVVFPADGGTLSSLPWISGTANDGSGAGAASVEVRLRRLSDGSYWNFFGDVWSGTPISTSVAAGASWAYSPTDLLSANLVHQASYYAEVRATDKAVPALSGDFSAASSTFTFSDTTPPSAVSTLTGVEQETPGNIELSWTAPGDDADVGIIRIGAYRIQYTTQTGVSFSTPSAQVQIATASVVPGSLQRHTIPSLIPGATYLVYLWTDDGEGNWSALSGGATITATPTPFSQIKGHVMKVSSEGISAVLLEAYDESGLIVSSTFTLTDGSGTFTLDGIPGGSPFRVVASWISGEITSSVWIDGVFSGTIGVDFFLEIDYTLSTLTGTLGSVAAQTGSPSGFLSAAGADGFKRSEIELFQRNRRVAAVPVDPTGRWRITNLLPGRYAVRAFNGFEYTKMRDIDLLEGEVQEVAFVFDPLPADEVYAFPNPARHATTLRFSSTLPGLEAQMMIFDIAGNLVKEIAGSEMSSPRPSVYHFPWDLRNNDGEGVASGVYLFMVKVRGSNGQSAKVIKKLAVVK